MDFHSNRRRESHVKKIITDKFDNNNGRGLGKAENVELSREHSK